VFVIGAHAGGRTIRRVDLPQSTELLQVEDDVFYSKIGEIYENRTFSYVEKELTQIFCRVLQSFDK